MEGKEKKKISLHRGGKSVLEKMLMVVKVLFRNWDSRQAKRAMGFQEGCGK